MHRHDRIAVDDLRRCELRCQLEVHVGLNLLQPVPHPHAAGQGGNALHLAAARLDVHQRQWGKRQLFDALDQPVDQFGGNCRRRRSRQFSMSSRAGLFLGLLAVKFDHVVGQMLKPTAFIRWSCACTVIRLVAAQKPSAHACCSTNNALLRALPENISRSIMVLSESSLITVINSLTLFLQSLRGNDADEYQYNRA